DQTGLAAVLAAVPVVDDEVVDVDFAINGATVVATGVNSEAEPTLQNRWLVLADGQAAILMFLSDAAAQAPFPIRVGHRVSLRATRVTRFNGVPAITGSTDWQLDSEDNPVYVLERTGQKFVDSDLSRVVRVTGQLGTPQACGEDHQCFPLDTDDVPGHEIFLRTNQSAAMAGNCVTFVGPVSRFGGELQLNVLNEDWVTFDCTPDCAGRSCGSDGCGGNCGTPTCASGCDLCGPDEICTPEGTCESAPTGPAAACPWPEIAGQARLEEGI